MSLAHALVVALASLGGQPAGEVIDFSASYCPPCRTMSPIVARLEREGLPIRKVDIEQDRALAEQYRITSIPTFVLVIDGREVTRIVGATTEAELRRLCHRIPDSQPAPGEGQFAAAPGQSPRRVDPPRSRAHVEPPLGTAVAQTQESPGGFLDFLRGRKTDPPQVARGSDAEIEPQTAAVTTDPMAASVRIRVTINGTINLGSGTVVDSRPGRTLIVTCGHIFRDMNDSTKVDVDLFVAGKPRTFVASVVNFDLQADVGLISIATDAAVSAAPIAPPSLVLEPAQRVACVGCSGGSDPTREQLVITAINKYTGPDNIECTGTPVQGRSGGGLFNTNGELVGVCIAADQQANRGLYAHAFAIHALLDRCHLSHLYQPAAPPADTFADATQMDATDTAPLAGTADLAAQTTADALAAANPVPGTDPAPAGVTADVAAGEAEVVVIIRSRDDPHAQSRVVIINRASPKFLAYLNGELQQNTQGLAASTITPTARTIPAAPSAAQPSGPSGRGPRNVETRRPSDVDAFQPPRSVPKAPERTLSQRVEARRMSLAAAK